MSTGQQGMINHGIDTEDDLKEKITPLECFWTNPLAS
jgi:hypothetical protein